MSINNIFNCEFDQFASTSSLHVGDTVNLKQTSKQKSLAQSEPIGDGAINVQGGANLYIDPDIVDNTRIRR
ncbi:MAG: spore germination protein [Thermoactinomyces sp.]